MKKFILFLLAWIFLFPLLAQAYESERIISFRSDIKVNEDSSMTVVETIEVQSNGVQIKRGIYRDFPTSYEDNWGNKYKVGFQVLNVKRDGQAEGYFLERQSNGERVYIGRKDYFLTPGVYTYTLTYRTTRQIGFFKDHDELYWNVTGNGWSFPIDSATASVELPSDWTSQVLSVDGFTGRQGARGKDFSVTKDAWGIVFKSTRAFGAYEGLTILVSWPKGLMKDPSFTDRVKYFLIDNRGVLLALLGFLALIVYYIIVWEKVGRDPPKGVVVPLYEPPERFSPALTRYIYIMDYDNKVFTSNIINLAVKGALTIHETGKKHLAKTKRTDLQLTEEETLMMKKLFGPDDMIELDGTRYEELQDARNLLKSSLAKSAERIYFNTNVGYFAFGVLLSIIFIFLSAMSDGLGWITVVSVAVYFVIDRIFYRLLKAPTLSGRKIMDKIEGFRMYLSVAEKDRLNMINPPEKTPELFEKYLPYAIALGVEQKWAQKFAEVLKNASSAGDYHPVWYYGNSWNPSHPQGFGSHMANSFAGVIAAAATAPGSSSGGGGGGFSGGGGGGGGGGGW